jgi:hypothetical protein
MCIILASKKKNITKTEIVKGFITNPDGWGIWSEKTLQTPRKGYKLNSLLNLFSGVKIGKRGNLGTHFNWWNDFATLCNRWRTLSIP